MIRLATIGTSGICSDFLSGMALTNEYTLSAVYSRTLDTGNAFAKKHGCTKVFTNLNEMAESSEIDAVYIASPNKFHAEQSRIFLQHGKHVLCEKPIVTNLDEYIELKALADNNGLIYCEAIKPIFIRHYSAVKEALKEIGEISIARIDFSQRSSRLDAFLSGENVNIFNPALCAGTFMDLGIYCVWGAVDLFGKPKSITAQKSLLHNGADGAGAAIFDYGKFLAILTYSKTGQSFMGSEIIGESGTLKIGSISQYSDVTLIKNGKEIPIAPILSKAEQMQGEAQRFADYINNFEQTSSDYNAFSKQCLIVHSCMEQIRNSAQIKFN